MWIGSKPCFRPPALTFWQKWGCCLCFSCQIWMERRGPMVEKMMYESETERDGTANFWWPEEAGHAAEVSWKLGSAIFNCAFRQFGMAIFLAGSLVWPFAELLLKRKGKQILISEMCIILTMWQAPDLWPLLQVHEAAPRDGFLQMQVFMRPIYRPHDYGLAKRESRLPKKSACVRDSYQSFLVNEKFNTISASIVYLFLFSTYRSSHPLCRQIEKGQRNWSHSSKLVLIVHPSSSFLSPTVCIPGPMSCI